MNATCEFVVGESDNVLAVSSDAIHDDGSGGSYVEVVDSGKPLDPSNPATLIDVKSHRQKVTTGLAGNDMTEIKSGLAGGESVVVGKTTPTAASAPATTGAAFGGGGPGGPPGMRAGGGTRGR